MWEFIIFLLDHSYWLLTKWYLASVTYYVKMIKINAVKFVKKISYTPWFCSTVCSFAPWPFCIIIIEPYLIILCQPTDIDSTWVISVGILSNKLVTYLVLWFSFHILFYHLFMAFCRVESWNQEIFITLLMSLNVFNKIFLSKYFHNFFNLKNLIWLCS